MNTFPTSPGKEKFTITELLIIVAIISLLVIPPISWHFESKAYNRLTGAKTTWWDAVWLELRVQDAPLKQEAK